MPRFSISNYTNVGIDNAFQPYYRNDPQYHYMANVNWITGGAVRRRFRATVHESHPAGIPRRQPRRTGRLQLRRWSNATAQRPQRVLLALNIPAPDAFTWAGRLHDGIPRAAAPDLGDGIIDIPDAVGVNSVPQNFDRGYIQSWNLMLQKQLWAGFTGQAGYVATRSTKQLGYFDHNAGQVVGAGRNGHPYFQQVGRFARTAAGEPVGNSKYDSLQATLTRRFSNGLLMNLSYTFSKAIGICGVTNSDNNPCIQCLPGYNLNRALMGFDRTHNFQANFVAELPFGRGRALASGGLASKLFGGWQVNGIFSAYSGTPFTVTSSGNSLNLPGSSQRADLVKPQVRKLGGVGRGQAYYDWTAFAPVTEPRLGTAGFNILRGPELVNLDMGIFRRFRSANGSACSSARRHSTLPTRRTSATRAITSRTSGSTRMDPFSRAPSRSPV